MNYIAIAGVILLLIIIVFQDLKFRKIHVALPLLIFGLSLFISKEKFDLPIKIIITNLVFFIIVIGFLVLYMSLKNRKFLNPFTNYFGLGDFLFYMSIAPLFVTFNYILFFILSMVFSIIMQLSLRKMMDEKSVPLAGFSSLFLLLILIKDMALIFPKMTLI